MYFTIRVGDAKDRTVSFGPSIDKVDPSILLFQIADSMVQCRMQVDGAVQGVYSNKLRAWARTRENPSSDFRPYRPNDRDSSCTDTDTLVPGQVIVYVSE